MSIHVIKAVFESALEPHLRLTALAMADFAAKDGTSIYPSVETVARMTGKQPRAVKNDLRALRELGVLVPDNLRGGRQKTTHYSMNLSTLRNCCRRHHQTVQRGAPFVAGATNESVHDAASFKPSAAGAQRVHSETETVQSTTETVQPTASDPSEDPLVIHTKPPLPRRSKPGATRHGKEQRSYSSTPLHYRERRSAHSSTSNSPW